MIVRRLAPALGVALLIVSLPVMGQRLEPSSCDGVLRPAGVGYVPPAGSRSCLYVLPNGSGGSACFPMDLSADPFVGGLSNGELLARAERRYGPNFHGADASRPRFLALDFESLLGLGGVLLKDLCCQDRFGTKASRSCNATLTELHDYFAVNSPPATPGRGNPPGQPRITELSSPAPGKVSVKWITRAGHTLFEVRAGTVTTTTAGDVFLAQLDLPPGEGGSMDVTVRAFSGDTPGKPSIAKTIQVQPRTAPPPAQPPEPPVTPPVEPPVTPPATPSAPVLDGCFAVEGLPAGTRLQIKVVPAGECKEVKP
jgi:hypothetical protein